MKFSSPLWAFLAVFAFAIGCYAESAGSRSLRAFEAFNDASFHYDDASSSMHHRMLNDDPHDDDGDHHDDDGDHHDDDGDHHDDDCDHHDDDCDHHDDDGDHHDDDGDHHDDDGDHHGEGGAHLHGSQLEDNGDDKPWGEVIIATLIVNLATLIGLALPVLGLFQKKKESNWFQMFVRIVMPSFAAGALLATAVFLIIPESLALFGGGHGDAHGDEHHDHGRFLQDEHSGHEEESEAAWKFGSAILSGFFLPSLFGIFFPHSDGEDCCRDCENTKERHSNVSNTISEPCDANECGHLHKEGEVDKFESKDLDESSEVIVEFPATPVDDKKQEENDKKPQYNQKLISSILLGDALHNFADGVFIGTAFMLCTRSLAITIAATTIYHELAQEIADFLLLTNHGGLSTLVALLLNFVSGLSVVLGGIIIVGLGDIGDTAVATILALSSGVYIHIAASECLPRVEKSIQDKKEKLVSLMCFILGAIPIGLVLLNHGHCG